jgi:hypothetical protein
MVMERMKGIPISRLDELRAAGIDLKKLSRAGVEIFFTQVFRDGFFHADMHPGNIFVATDGPARGRYIALDFGIIGTLNDSDKKYLATNFLAFFQRDYRRVALAHIEAGWVPSHTRVDEFEAPSARCANPSSTAPQGHLVRQDAAAPLPDRPPLRDGGSTPARTTAKNPAQHRRPRAPARPGPRPVENRQTLPRTLDERPDGLARCSTISSAKRHNWHR